MNCDVYKVKWFNNPDDSFSCIVLAKTAERARILAANDYMYGEGDGSDPEDHFRNCETVNVRGKDYVNVEGVICQ